MKKVIICVPTHKSKLNLMEEASLKQLCKVMKEYDIAMCIPDDLDDSIYKKQFGLRIEKFSKSFFLNFQTYQNLCLSTLFYERFHYEYEYMFLYQLDGFVFSDRLTEFCDMGYDYIGAPTTSDLWERIDTSIGCGGVSLRQIEKCLQLLINRRNILDYNALSWYFHNDEDLFWGYCGRKKELDFSVPDIYVASDFCLQMDVGGKLNNLIFQRDLPFSTHAWNRLSYDIWKKIIEEYGYELPDVDNVKYMDGVLDGKRWYRFYQIREKIEKCGQRIGLKAKEFEHCSIWGAGVNGKRLIRLFENMNITIDTVFDKDMCALLGCEDIKHTVICPNEENLPRVSGQIILTMNNRQEAMTLLDKLEMPYIWYEDVLCIIEECING